MSNLKLALENTMKKQIAEYENDMEIHEFSNHFEKRMSKLIKRVDSGSFVFSEHRISLRRAVQIAFIIIILAVLAVAAYAVISWSSFKVEEYDIYSLLNAMDISDAPLTLEEKYEIGADMSEYETDILTDDEHMVYVCYNDLHNKDKYLVFCQRTKNSFQSVRINTENSEQTPTMIEVNGYIGLYMQTDYQEHFILWDNGEYFIEVTAGNAFGINELIPICNSVQKVE